MKKTMLYTAIMILSTVVYADNTPAGTAMPTQATQPKPTDSMPSAVIQTAPVTSAPATNQQPAVIDCKYRIPATTKTVDQTTIITWARKAAVQSFEFNPTTIDTELGVLKECYTEQGWQGFNDALQKSGNINAIKEQHLNVSSQVNGDIIVNNVKENQWKVTVPMQVLYQNEKEKLTQDLMVDLLIGRKMSGDLGIMQMIATPRQNNAPATQPATATPPATQANPMKPAPATKP